MARAILSLHPRKGQTPMAMSHLKRDDEGLYIPSYLEAIPDDPVLQVKMARAM